MKPKLLCLAVASSCLVAACNRSPSPLPQGDAPLAPDVLARVESQTIRLTDFESELHGRARGRSGALVSTEAREAVLREMVNFESTYLRAKQAGFDQKPEIARQIKAFIVNRFIEEQYKDQPESPAVSDAEVAEYYRNHTSRFVLPEKIRFAVIHIGFSSKATDEKKAEVLQKAELVLREARALGDSERGFGMLAQRHSEDQATRYLGGDAGWLARGEQCRWDPAVIDAAFALTTSGNLSPVIQTPTGVYLVRLIEKKDAGHRPLEEVAGPIRYQLATEKRHLIQQEFYKAMTTGLKIEINRPLLESIPAPRKAREVTPPALPGS